MEVGDYENSLPRGAVVAEEGIEPVSTCRLAQGSFRHWDCRHCEGLRLMGDPWEGGYARRRDQPIEPAPCLTC